MEEQGAAAEAPRRLTIGLGGVVLRLNRVVHGIAVLAAVVGGLVLSATIIITCVSIAGRALGWGSVRGDVELVQSGMAFAIFAFLPLCQITAGHASVDIFTNWMSGRPFRFLILIIEIVFAITLVYIAMQLRLGMEDRIRSGQTTFLLQYPVWWSYAASLGGATLAAATGIWVALVRFYELVFDREVITSTAGAEH